MKSLKVGFFMGLGLGFVISSVIMFTIAIGNMKEDVSKISNNEIKNQSMNNINNSIVNNNEEDEFVNKEKGQSKEVEDDEYIEVNIPKGSSSKSVAQLLYDNKVIDNATKFDEYTRDRDKARKIKYGVYKIPKSATYKEVLDIIIK